MQTLEKQIKGLKAEDSNRIEMEKHLGILKRSNTYTSGLVSGALSKSYQGRAHSDNEPSPSIAKYANPPTSQFLISKVPPREPVNVNRLSHSVSSPTITSTTTYQSNNNNDQVYLGES